MNGNHKEILYKDNYRGFFVERHDNEVLFKMRRDTDRINFSVPIDEFNRKYGNIDEGELRCLEHKFCSRSRPYLSRVPGYGADEESEELFVESRTQTDYLFKIFITKKQGKLDFRYECEENK